MRFTILLIMLPLLLASCDRAPLSMIYSNMPSDYEISAAEKAVVEGGLAKFLNVDTLPRTEHVKTLKYASGTVKVCGLMGNERLFAGYLLGAPGNQTFDVIAVADISDPFATNGIDVERLCRS